MKLCCFNHLFLLTIICVPFLFLDSSGATRLQTNAANYTVIGGDDEQVEYGIGEMLSDDSVPGIEDGDGNVVLRKLCPSCKGTSTVCFETTENTIGSTLKCTGFPSYCSFKVRYDNANPNNEKIFFGETLVYKSQFAGQCLTPVMQSGTATAVGNILFDSCSPKFDHAEKMIKLYVDIKNNCPIKVMNAKIHVPKILTTLFPKTTPTTRLPPGQAKESTADAGFPWWAYLIIAAGCVLALIVIGVIVYFVCFKKPKTSKALPPPEIVVTQKPTTKVKVAGPDVQPPTTTAAAPSAPETKNTPSSTRKEDLNFTKFEPSKKSKKIQKKPKKETTTQEPTEDAPPAPGSRQPVFDLSNAPEPVYKPVPYPKPHRLVPLSMKSAKTDSLEKTLPKEKKERIETVPDSVARHCLKSSESDVVQEMKSNYPEIQRVVMEVETELLGLPVSQMFKSIDGLARESKRKLSAVGCKFDKNRCITLVPEGARQMLQDEKTPATTVYFAFGAEYHKHVICDKLIVYSLPLLMVIALQKRFETRDRRQACALIRRKMPIVLANYTEAARQKMAYPMNAIEKAYCKDPKPFRNLSEIKTDSESERRMKEMKEAAAAAEKKETVPGGGHDAKRKKVSAKKRH